MLGAIGKLCRRITGAKSKVWAGPSEPPPLPKIAWTNERGEVGPHGWFDVPGNWEDGGLPFTVEIIKVEDPAVGFDPDKLDATRGD